MKQLPVVYSQRDPKWASQRLGTVDGSTIGAYGCYISSFSMMANFYGHSVTPAQLDDIYTNNGFYVNGNLCTDGSLQRAFADCVYQKTYSYTSSPADLNLLKSLLDDANTLVILELDFDHNPNDGI